MENTEGNIEETKNLDAMEEGPTFQEVKPVEEVPKGEKIKACLTLIRKMPITKYKKAVEGISNLIYEEDELLNEFLQKIDQPSEVYKQDPSGEFLMCEFNRDGDSYRSSTSNKYFPKPEEGEDELRFPSKELRDFEVTLNKMFKEYTKLYYNQAAISSCFVWQLTDNIKEGLCVAVVIKNDVLSQKDISGGCWDSSNLVVINFNDSDGKVEASYRLTTTVFFKASLSEQGLGHIEFNGSTTRMVR